ncbi:class I mannose-6-phosphate isomerase [Parenemella sanctibonifatiensis]|uniref:Mannose-6-phosphate isomerase n=1 Tax=Parenemella sanctibonifatiensis TaxID=2016505 RepID=A0A255EL40_9ACTN|nr:class I mannose-6-phosphate isomerase [Parenemella sanctibonifatiensis]OYN90325.1 mannose-6-phosphate isomerase [Parenemella sanctibonifatiensis]
MKLGHGNYDRRPVVRVPAAADNGQEAWRGAAAWQRLGSGEVGAGEPDAGPADRRVVVIDTVPGVDVADLMSQLSGAHPEATVVDVAQAAALPGKELDQLLASRLTDDRVFGKLTHEPLEHFYDADRLAGAAERVGAGLTFLVGWGAALVPVEADCVVLADLPRWETQQRQRQGAPNWGCDNGTEDPLRKYKRSYFVEWRTADRHKQDIWSRLDLVLDTTAEAVLVTADAVRRGLASTARRPFRVMPYFDPGSWGGQWMREVCGLDAEPPNFAWCFDCVPEENSLLLEIDGSTVELPAQNLVLQHPAELLGRRTRARFGAEFPIRFDLLDTMGGGNLSLQVHPLTEYIQREFGMPYTQDESYYLLDAAPGAHVYLGLREGIDPEQMMADLRTAQQGGADFVAEDYVNTFPARPHDHFLIPAGTVHSSGADSMVLEISATPYIFTFKMWDWGRLGLDGKPRPINIDHAEANIQWDRDTAWVEQNLVGQVAELAASEGWREERTGLHELEFIETRRHWIRGRSEHHTHGTVQVKNLVHGAEALVESPTGAFEPFVVHYAETFIVPAAVGAYTVRPHGPAVGTEIATITAWVRGTETTD